MAWEGQNRRSRFSFTAVLTGARPGLRNQSAGAFSLLNSTDCDCGKGRSNLAAESLRLYVDAGFGGFTLSNMTSPTVESIGQFYANNYRPHVKPARVDRPLRGSRSFWSWLPERHRSRRPNSPTRLGGS